MKKIIALLLVLLLVCVMTVPAFAEEPAEEITEVEEETEENAVSVLIEDICGKLANTSFWVSISSYLSVALAVLLTIKKLYDKVKNLFAFVKESNGQNAADIIEKVKDLTKEGLTEYKAQIADLQSKLVEQESEAKKLSVILSIMATNMKIPSSAKSEIVAFLNGANEVKGTVAEIVEAVKETVAEAEEETKDETPALDSILEEKDINLA